MELSVLLWDWEREVFLLIQTGKQTIAILWDSTKGCRNVYIRGKEWEVSLELQLKRTNVVVTHLSYNL